MTSLPKQFVYAQQDILGGTNRTNDLVVVNDADYRDSGICVGPGGPYNNMRLAYSVTDAAGSINTDKLNVNVEQLYFNNLPNAQNSAKPHNYIVSDLSGNIKEGFPMYKGDLNNEVSTIKDDIILIKQNLGLPIVKTISIEGILSYIAIGLSILFLIILIILLFRLHRLNKRIQALEEQETASIAPPPPPRQAYYPPYYPYPPQMMPPPQQMVSSPVAQMMPPPQQMVPPPQQMMPPQAPVPPVMPAPVPQMVSSPVAPPSVPDAKQFSGYYYY